MPSGPIDLLDINVWLALADENHAHHFRARRYWEEESSSQIAFCRVTMLGLLRLATNSKVMHGQPFAPSEIWQAYRNFRSLPEVTLMADPSDLELHFSTLTEPDHFPNHRWTDAYLAALSQATSSRLVSFDSDFKHFKGLRFFHLKP